MFDFSRNIGLFVLPAEFRAKEVDEHLDNEAQGLENNEEMLEGHHIPNQDDVQMKKSPCLSNTSDQAKSVGTVIISQFDHLLENNTCISNIITNNSKRTIREINILIGNNKVFKFSISSLPKFMSAWFAYDQSRARGTKLKLENINEVDATIVDSSKSSDMGNLSNCVAEWVDSKSEPFVCLALKLPTQKCQS
jgi:hypothetical protein